MITLTDRAALELIRIAREDPRVIMKRLCVRVGVLGGGCSGFSYNIGFDDSAIAETDLTFDHGTILLICDSKSFLYLNGMSIDFEESLMGRGFKFQNPNATKSCGCGESFSVS